MILLLFLVGSAAATVCVPFPDVLRYGARSDKLECFRQCPLIDFVSYFECKNAGLDDTGTHQWTCRIEAPEHMRLTGYLVECTACNGTEIVADSCRIKCELTSSEYRSLEPEEKASLWRATIWFFGILAGLMVGGLVTGCVATLVTGCKKKKVYEGIPMEIV